MSFFRQILFSAFMVVGLCESNAQQTIGTCGLMNIPSADMYAKKTFVGGANYLASGMVHYDYPLFDYYIGFTPFKFVELTFRSTLLKQRIGEPYHKFCEQDRSYTIRLQPLAEKDNKWWPGIVLGWNDFFSEVGLSYYSAVYGVATKHVSTKIGRFGVTCGYSRKTDKGDIYNGVFGGFDYSPTFFQNARVMAEYDTKGVNVGAEILLFKHWNFLVFTREFRNINAGFAYHYTIKY